MRKNRNRWLWLLMAGTLILGCPAMPAQGIAEGKDIIVETLPDLSAVDGKIPILIEEEERDSINQEMGFGMAEIDTDDIQAGADSFEKKVTYTTCHEEEEPGHYLEESLQIHGDEYKLVSVGQALKIRETEITPQRITFESEVFTGDGTEQEPEKTITGEDGKSYCLVKKELREETAKERREYKEAIVTFTAVEAGVQIPQEKESEFEDADTSQTVNSILGLKNQEVMGEYWEDNFTFPVTITGYDADILLLNGKEIPKDADLTDYSEDFLEYLKLDSQAYEISSIVWSGEPYTENGLVMRKATAKGRKWVKDIRATYGGEVQMPAIVGKVWDCLYEETIPEDERVCYTMAVNVRYEREDVAPVTVKSLPERILDRVVGMITAAYEAVAAAFEEHPVISTIPLVVIAVFITLILAKRIRNACIYDDTIKCPYRKHDAVKCRSCVNYCKRNQV